MPEPAVAPPGHEIVIFDGVCNLCCASVQFSLGRERDAHLSFTPLPSIAGARWMRDAGLDPAQAATVVLLSGGVPNTRSEAALRIARHLRRPWRWAAAARIVPRALRDWLCDRVANNRYHWFGRTRTCMVPSPALALRFIAE
jgi:predicted DCC family thiol-disulfide oxidoreductase YuxK